MGVQTASPAFNAVSAYESGARRSPVFSANPEYGTNPAVGGSAKRVKPAEVLPSSFVFAGRDPNIERIAVRMTGCPPGNPGNHPRELYRRDTAAGLTHSACHMLVLTDGGIVHDPQHLRPLNQVPQAAAGQNERSLAIYVEGDRTITGHQHNSLKDIAFAVEGITLQPVRIVPATQREAGLLSELARSTSAPAVGRSLGYSMGVRLSAPSPRAPTFTTHG